MGYEGPLLSFRRRDPATRAPVKGAMIVVLDVLRSMSRWMRFWGGVHNIDTGCMSLRVVPGSFVWTLR